MKAVYYEKYGPPEVVSIKEIETPSPKPGEIRVRVRATALTFGDTELRSPRIPDFTWFVVRLFLGLFRPRFKIFGSYFAGDVESLGAGVTSFEVGDKVFGLSTKFGAHAEYLCVHSDSAVTKMASNSSYSEAAPVGLGLDSLHFVRKCKINKGERMLVNGAGGGIGTYAVQLAKYFGAHVTSVDGPDQVAMLSNISDDVIDYQSQQVVELGKKYDIIFDVVGKIPLRTALGLLNKNGRYVSAIPLLSRIISAPLLTLFSSKKIQTGLTDGKKEDLNYMRELFEANHLQTIIDSTYRMDRIVDAHNYLEKRMKSGNVILDIF